MPHNSVGLEVPVGLAIYDLFVAQALCREALRANVGQMVLGYAPIPTTHDWFSHCARLPEGKPHQHSWSDSAVKLPSIVAAIAPARKALCGS